MNPADKIFMNQVDEILRDAYRRLDPREKQALDRHLEGRATRESWAVMRKIRAELKRFERAKTHPKVRWLA
jgi:hypothetical protein